MKNVKIAIIATIITIALLFTTALAITPAVAESLPDGCYDLTAVVVGWEYTDDLTLRIIDCLAEDGNVWSFYAIRSDGWEIGDAVILIMLENDEEDEVVDVLWLDHLEEDELARFLRIVRW